MKKVAVIGSGISGTSAARFLKLTPSGESGQTVSCHRFNTQFNHQYSAELLRTLNEAVFQDLLEM